MAIQFMPLHYNAEEIATCGDCQHQCRAGNCEPIRDPGERLSAGDPLPAGECPECGSLSYVREALLNDIVKRFPGFVEDDHVNGADLVEFIGEQLQGH